MDLFQFERPQVADSAVRFGIRVLTDKIHEKLKEKGRGIFISSHEILGAVTEEYNELERSVESDKIYSIQEELIDVAIAALFGYISIEECIRCATEEIGEACQEAGIPITDGDKK